MVYFPRYTPKRYHSHFSCFSKWPNLFFLLSHLVSLHPVMSPNRIFFPPGIIHSQSCTILPQTHIQFYSYHSLRCKMQLAWSKWPSRKMLFFSFMRKLNKLPNAINLILVRRVMKKVGEMPGFSWPIAGLCCLIQLLGSMPPWPFLFWLFHYQMVLQFSEMAYF